MNDDEMMITVNLEDVLVFVKSELFQNFLTNNTTISNQLFINQILIKTINYMIEDVDTN